MSSVMPIALSHTHTQARGARCVFQFYPETPDQVTMRIPTLG